jgi:integrase
MKLDVFNRQGSYENWKEDVIKNGIQGLSRTNSAFVLEYIFDMERGENVAIRSKKGKRSFSQLNKLRQKLIQTIKRLEKRKIKDVTKTTSTEILTLFSDIESGKIKKEDGREYGDVSTDIKCFKSFWHWWMKINRKKNKIILDITEDLSSAQKGDHKFVYLAKEQLEEMLPYFEKKEQTILMFVFDSLIRCPTEIRSLKVKNIYEEDGEVWVNVPDEISKVRGRSFNLLFSGKAVLEFIKENNLKQDDFLFDFSSDYLNWKMQKVAKQIWDDKISPKSGESYSKITLYDLRHSGTIHLRIMAKENPGEVSLDAIRERGGWSDFKMINYYTKFIGIDGKIDKQGILIKKDKSKMQEDIDLQKKINNLLCKKMINQISESEFKKELGNLLTLQIKQVPGEKRQIIKIIDKIPRTEKEALEII